MHAIGLDLERFAQELRRSHCSHGDAGKPTHVCIGACTIRRDGVILECSACGNGQEMISPTEWYAGPLRVIFGAAGISWDSLSPEAQRAAAEAFKTRKT